MPPGSQGSMLAELNWWLWSLHLSGERVNSWNLAIWVRLAEALGADAGIASYVDWTAAEWVAVHRRAYHDRRGRVPPKTYEQNLAPVIRRLHTALSRACESADWWRADVWDARHDPRIPLRAHEALGGSRLSSLTLLRTGCARRSSGTSRSAWKPPG